MKEYVIVVAGGAGKRMGTQIPKQFLMLSGRPLLMHTINAFFLYSNSIQIILALPDSMITYWNDLCKQFHFTTPHQITAGGATRYQSVKNGLTQIKEPAAIVAIHDGVRPLVTTDIIRKSFQCASVNGSAITSVRMKESLRKVSINKNTAVNRDNFRLIQTPQTFQLALIRHAYDLDENILLTDDAVVAEKAGVKIHLIEGSYDNIKITSKSDLLVAETIMNSKQKKTGRDHPA